MSRERRHLDPHPRFSSEEITGAQMSEPLAWLVGHMVDSLVVDDYELVSVDHRFEEHDGTVHVVCTDTTGSTHMFQYDPADGIDPVQHIVLGKVEQ